MASLKKNILLNYINTISGLIFPIVTFPYAARVLQPEGIGVVNFLNSIIGYVVLLTSLGIPLYAVREIAKCRNNLVLRDRTTVEITLLSVFLCLLGYVVVWLLGTFVPRIHEEAALFYILSLTIIFTGIGVHWFYQGIEDFLFITVRGLIIRTICAFCLFIFVKDQGDLLIYGLIIVGSTVGNNLINFVHLRKHLQWSRINWHKLNVTRHIKPTLRVFLLNVIISIYIQLNTIMLGFLSGDRAVGLFTAGTKLTHILLVVITSLGTVMLPRCSHLIGEGKTAEFNAIIQKSYYLLMFSAIPITIGAIILARPIMICFCGMDYVEAIPVIIYTAPTIIFIGITDIIGIQILYPYGKEKLVIYSTLIAAVLNVVLNLLLIPLFAERGAAISTLIAEAAVLVVQIKLGARYIPFKFTDRQVGHYLLASFAMALGIAFCLFIPNVWGQLLCACIVSICIYFLILYFKKDSVIQEITSMTSSLFFK